ncbi:MAG: DUF354 domain-containing protein [Kiritimatiellia bacterium]
MNILVEILHPAHVHFFRNAIAFWRERGDNVLVLSREKECANDLLNAYGIPYQSISAIHARKSSLLTEMLVRDWRMWNACRAFKPDVLTGIMGVTIAQVGKLIRKPAIVFYDTENATLTNRIVYPLAHSVCTPDCYQGPVTGNHVTYPGYHELAYLHPNRFTPDPNVVKAGGIDPEKSFFILRLVSWQASHDVGEAGLENNMLQNMLARLKPHGRILISSEKPLPPELESMRFHCPPQDMHHFLAYATLLVGESATMASEAAVLGTPAFFISDTGRGYTDEEESRYGLVFNFKRNQQQEILNKLDELLCIPDSKATYKTRRAKLLADKIDTTGWIIQYLDRIHQSAGR